MVDLYNHNWSTAAAKAAAPNTLPEIADPPVSRRQQICLYYNTNIGCVPFRPHHTPPAQVSYHTTTLN